MKNLIGGIFVATLVLLANSISLTAQGYPKIVSGQRVRVTASKFLQRVNRVRIVRAREKRQSRYAGSLVTLKADTLVMRADGWEESFVVPLENLQKLEFSHGTKSNLGKGAKIGFLIGAGVGFISGAVAGSGNCLGFDDSADPEGCSISLGFVSGAFWGLLGAGIGVGGGAAQPGEVWEEVALERLR